MTKKQKLILLSTWCQNKQQFFPNNFTGDQSMVCGVVGSSTSTTPPPSSGRCSGFNVTKHFTIVAFTSGRPKEVLYTVYAC